ncbi:MAG: hypothetical protein QT08_C0009G0063 [archaeon GW2011_AR17]|nr:MAG: hypothetical protein QT08_C0009G0063 [archaeon GW2011_AR17]
MSLTLQLTYWKDLNTIASYIVPMVTSIQVSEELLKRHIKIAEKEIKEGKVVTLDQIKKNVGL